uniref:NADP-dependent oxidoreductase domain-containing protein n=1 Tax=Oncorhynchus tshawytscha TaxID=74940 RepID=A0A8C8C5V8_ONCTS
MNVHARNWKKYCPLMLIQKNNRNLCLWFDHLRLQMKQEVLAALDCGYKHNDCAAVYSKEQEVGEALALRLGPRKALRHEDVFLTSKLCNTQHHPDYVETACSKSLIHLGLEYLALYLMYWPTAFQ